MATKIIAVFLLPVLLITLAGCATFRKQSNPEIQSLKNQVSLLEAQLAAKDEELSSLREGLGKISDDRWEKAKTASKKKAIGEVKSRPSIKQIQAALTNAGYNPGVIDGRMGKQTREAIRAFQSANNLTVDGKVGKKTWGLLQDQLDKKVK
jgi:peptidoglycan hydrolase-like protein with peptidoglycan-binding domain